MSDIRKCPGCNADVGENDKFCPYCGFRFDVQNDETKPEPEKTEQYKCPSCGAPLKFSPTTGKLACESCNNEYDIGTIEQYAKNNTDASFKWDKKYREALKGTLPEMTVYNCRSCGAEIITDATTAATHCPYCDNEVIIAEKLTGALRPNGVIPFKILKDGIKEKIREFCRGKKLLPNNFFDEQKIDQVQGIYVPVWLFDGTLDGKTSYDATTTSSYISNSYRYTTTNHYLIECDGKMSFSRVPVDGSTKMDDDLMNSIEPYDYSQIVDFDGQYLSGFLADRFDQDPDESIPTASQRMMNSATQRFSAAIGSEYSKTLRNNELKLKDPSVKYVLLPVYLFNLSYKDKIYRFAMNGQTGKLVGELPIDKGKKRRAFWIPFLITFIIAFIIIIFLLTR
ncbi:MAG: hypothetical protein II777_06535 [Clostridia bacterium]|nr:hypothetical protein [Clostridia bacterium]